MNNHRTVVSRISALIVCCLTVGAAIRCQAEAPPESFVLISNGGKETIQRCSVVAEKNGYALSLRENARVWLPQERVLCIGKSMEEIYQFRKQRISQWSSGDHIKMGRWCLRYDLIDQAADHYLSIPSHLKGHPSVAQFGQSIKASMLEDTEFCQFIGLPQARKATQLATRQTTSESASGPKNSNPVVTASAQSHPTLTPEAKTRFFVKIQPILKNRCSQAACHGFRGKSDFRLYEPYGQAFNRIADANLMAAAAHATVKPGSVTPTLVEYATSAHGAQRSPSVTPQEAVLIGELEYWCSLVSSRVVSAEARVIGNANGAVTAGGSNTLPQGGLKPVGPGQNTLRAVPNGSPTIGETPTHGFPAGTSPPEMSEIDQLDQQLQQILNQAKQPTEIRPQPNATPSDPFDAAAFNNMPRK